MKLALPISLKKKAFKKMIFIKKKKDFRLKFGLNLLSIFDLLFVVNFNLGTPIGPVL